MSSLAQKTSDTRAFLVNHCFPSVLQPCTSRGMKMTSGSFLLAIFSSTSLALDACCSAQVCVDIPDWVSGQRGGRPAAWHRLARHRQLPRRRPGLYQTVLQCLRPWHHQNCWLICCHRARQKACDKCFDASKKKRLRFAPACVEAVTWALTLSQ